MPENSDCNNASNAEMYRRAREADVKERTLASNSPSNETHFELAP
jgi:hypothetical protein